jgi:hypothetical protein
MCYKLINGSERCRARASQSIYFETTWDPPDVGEDMDGDYREPDQGTEDVHGEQWASLGRAGHHELARGILGSWSWS